MSLAPDELIKNIYIGFIMSTLTPTCTKILPNMKEIVCKATNSQPTPVDFIMQ